MNILCKSFIKKVLFLFISFGAVFFIVTCGKSPNNPYSDYDNCKVDILPLPPDSLGFSAGDSIIIRIEVQAPSLFSSFIFSINSKDSIVSVDSLNWADTIVMKLIFADPDTYNLKVKAELQNKSRLSDSMMIVIGGKAPGIISNPPESLSVELGAACTLSVSASGTGPIFYQWDRNGKRLSGNYDTAFIIPNFQSHDTGAYHCIVSNVWGRDSSTILHLYVKKETNKSVYWNFAIHRDTVAEGDSLFIRVDSLYTIPADDSASLKTLIDVKQASFEGDSLFIFKAGARDSGSYSFPVEVATKSDKDTAAIEIFVKSRYCTLTLQADSGFINAVPAASSFRWGDTVSLSAVPKSGFLFVKWQGDAGGNDTRIKIIVVKNMTIRASFIAASSSECMQLTGGSLNKAIRDASPGAVRPKAICPEEGIYDHGTIRIWGKVRFTLEK